MAIYHFRAKVIQRSQGQSSVIVAARRSGTSLFDERVGLMQRPLSHDVPIHSEILLPVGAPPRWLDRAVLWNEIEAFERRVDAQVAREIEISLPIELPSTAAIGLAKVYASEVFVGAGMAVDLNVRIRQGSHSAPNPWASLLLTTRHLRDGEQGFKVLEWNQRRQLVAWRSEWAAFANAALLAHGFAPVLDHRSYAERGIDLEPQNKIGPAAARRARAGEIMERVEEHHAIAARNVRRGKIASRTPNLVRDASWDDRRSSVMPPKPE